MTPLYIFDLDGTLADTSHRLHYIEKKPANWNRFYKESVKDPLNESVANIYNALRKSGAEIWIWSGRSDVVALETIEWLYEKNLFDESHVISRVLKMRPKSDFRPDTELKKEWLDDMNRNDRDRLIATFDDRERIAKMWKNAGITCALVNIGDK